MVLEEGSESVFVHLIWDSSDEDFQIILVLHSVLLLLAQLPVFFRFGIFKRRQQRALLQVDALELGPVLPQFVSHHFSQVFQFLGNVEDHSFFVLELLHALHCFVELLWKLFSQEVPYVLQRIELNVHIEPVGDVSWHAQVQ